MTDFRALLAGRWRLWTGALLVLALLATALARWLLGPAVAVEPVALRDFVQSVVASGHVETPNRVDIGAQITGTVASVPVAEGQAVRAGDTLITLQDAEWRAAEKQAEVAVAQAEARLRQLRELQAPVAEQARRQAATTLDNARAQLRRSQDLAQKGFIGEAAIDDARKAVELAEAQLATAQKQLETTRPGGSDMAVAETALAQARAGLEAAQARAGYAVLRAPRDGVLIGRNVEVGDVVQPGKVLMTLSPSGRTQLVVDIDEKNLRLVALGQPARASADAYANERFEARVAYINPGVNAQTGAVEVKLDVPAPPPTLRQDMTVSVDIEVARRPAALLVPADAVHDIDGAEPWVLRLQDGHAKRQPLKLGLRSGGWCEVLAGLNAGDAVLPATAGVNDGARVRPAAEARPR